MFTLLAGWIGSPALALTSVTTVKSSPATVSKLAKYELSFTLSRTFPADSFLPYYYYDAADTPAAFPGRTSPYGADGITVNVVFTSPTGVQKTVPAFYYQDFTRTQAGNGDEIMTPLATIDWRARFTPEEVGTYSYYITVSDKDGTSRYPTTGATSFSVSASSNKGFLRVSPTDSRFFTLSSGQDFVPIGSGHQWWTSKNATRSYDYETTFNDFGKNGVNFVRLWTQNDGYALTVESHFDHYKWPDDFNPENRIDLATIPKGTQINMRGAYELDKITEAAERNGIYMVLSSHEDPYWIWDVPREDLLNPLYLNYWKRNYRYRIARWGYSPAVGAIEHWNEHGHIAVGSNLSNFYQTLSTYIRSIDPFGHLFTTSQGSQAYSPAFYSTNAMSIVSYHDYLMSSRYSADLFGDETNFLYRAAQCLRAPKTTGCFFGDGSNWTGAQKPIFWGEFDTSGPTWNDPGTPSLLAQHNGLWSGLFSSAGSSPLDWFWDSQTFIPEKLADKKVASTFFSDISYASAQFTHLSTADVAMTAPTVTASDAKIRALVLRASNGLHAYAWVQHKDSTWQRGLVTTPVTGTVTIPGLSAGTYTITTTNTKTGTTTSTTATAGTGGAVVVPVTGLTTDVAIKIRNTNYVPTSPAPTTAPTPTPVATPTAVPATPTPTPAGITPTCNANINGDTIVDISDYSLLVQNFFVTPPKVARADIDANGIVDIVDYSIFVKSLFLSCPAIATPTPVATVAPTPVPTVAPTTPPVAPTPTPSPITSAGEWTQFGSDSQKTSYAATIPATPWKYKWQWNGAGADGKKQAGHLSVPDYVQPITGGNRVYMIAANQVYALDKTTGSQIWTKGSIGTLTGTGVYDAENLYIGSSNGIVYKLNAATGATTAQFTGAGSFGVSLTLANGTLFAGSSNGTLYAINPTTMSQVWAYAAGFPIVTPSAYSPSKSTIIVNSQDLYVHAINVSTGARIWRVKPTPRTYQAGTPTATGAQFEEGWPVIAEQHGIVFVRYRLDWDTLWTWNPFPTTNAAIKANLISRPDVQPLFALNLNNGTQAFVPNVGNGGAGDGGTLPMGPQPVIRNINGKEVAYIIWRNGLTCAAGWCDGREDAAMGEMVLDGTTVAGYGAGDVRFIRNPDIQTDEMMNITMAGDTIFHSHWLINSAEKITDRSDALGSTYLNPIKTTDSPFVIWRQVYCPTTNSTCNPQLFPGGTTLSYGPANCQFNATSRYCSAGLYSYGDQRGYPAGFYEYHNDNNSGTTPFTVVSGGLVLVKTNDGGLIALENGNPGASAATVNPIVMTSLQSTVLGASTEPLPTVITHDQAKAHMDEYVSVTGTIASAVDHMPKGIYLGFTNPHDGHLLVRIFGKDVKNFPYDLLSLKGKKITVTGKITLYWPEGKDPEIIVTSPDQISVQ